VRPRPSPLSALSLDIVNNTPVSECQFCDEYCHEVFEPLKNPPLISDPLPLVRLTDRILRLGRPVADVKMWQKVAVLELFFSIRTPV
jgi:hypothetical protein